MIRFSVIIPTRNRPRELANCLASLRRLDYPPSAWELIVVNDGGESSLVRNSHDLGRSLSVRFIDIDHAGPGAARNAGAKLARGEYLAFTDDDCRVDPDWLGELEAAFRDGEPDALGGRILNPFPDSLAAQAHQHFLEFLYSELTDTDKNPLMLVSANVAYRRPVFEALNGFDESMTIASEDRELSSRLLASGYQQRYCSAARVWHHRQVNWVTYIRLQFRYGRGQLQFQRAQRRFGASPAIAPTSPTRFWFALARWLRRVRAPLSAWLLLCVAQIAHRLGCVYQGWRER